MSNNRMTNNNKQIKRQHYNYGGFTKINEEEYIRCSIYNVKRKNS